MNWKEFFKPSISKIFVMLIMLFLSWAYYFNYDKTGCQANTIDCGFSKRGFPIPFFIVPAISLSMEIFWLGLVIDLIFYYVVTSLLIYLYNNLVARSR